MKYASQTDVQISLLHLEFSSSLFIHLISRKFLDLQYPARYQLALTCSVNFSKIYFALSNFLAFVPPELFCQKPPALFPLASPWLKIVCPVDIKVLQPRPAHVPRHLHVQWHDDAVEDVNEEEVGQLVDPEDLGWGEEGNVVLTELQKAEAMPDKCKFSRNP